MRFNSVKSGNFTSAAKAVNRSADQMFKASRDSAPDFTGISKAAIASRTKERNAATNAQNLKDVTNIKADALIEGTRIKGDLDKSLAKTKQGSTRMAGITGALGSIAGGFMMKADKAAEKLQREKDDLRDQKRDAQMTAILNKPQAEFSFDEEAPTNPGLKPDTGSTDTTTTSAPTSTTSISTASTGGGGGSAIRGEVYSYLTEDKGLSKNKALGLMANIDRESSFRTAPSGGDGGNSFGMFQWNNTYGRSDIMKDNVKDWKTNWRGQIDHALSGNQLPEYNEVSSDFLNTTFDTPQQAADYWMTKWERPADTKSGSSKHTQFIGGYNF